MGATVPRIERTCEYCGKKFLTMESRIRIGGAKFCSKICNGKNKRIDIRRRCPQCGVFFTVKNWIVTKGGGKYCSLACSIKIGENSPSWRGGTHITGGYKVIDQRKEKVRVRIFEHRKIIEESIGRPLTTNEIVHHIDGDRLNNSLENLQVLSRADHLRLHLSAHGKWSRDYGDRCSSCGDTSKKHAALGLCTKCYWIYKKQKDSNVC